MAGEDVGDIRAAWHSPASPKLRFSCSGYGRSCPCDPLLDIDGCGGVQIPVTGDNVRELVHSAHQPAFAAVKKRSLSPKAARFRFNNPEWSQCVVRMVDLSKQKLGIPQVGPASRSCKLTTTGAARSLP